MHSAFRPRICLRHDHPQGFRNGYVGTPIILKPGTLQTQVRQQPGAAHHAEQPPQPLESHFAAQHGVAHRQHVQGLHLTMPHIFMRMNHVVALARHAPGRIRKQQLIDPSRTPHGPTNRVVMDTGKDGANRLRKNMHVMALTQLFRQCQRIPFRTSAPGIEILGQKRNTESLQNSLTSTQYRIFPAPHRLHSARKSVCR